MKYDLNAELFAPSYILALFFTYRPKSGAERIAAKLYADKSSPRKYSWAWNFVWMYSHIVGRITAETEIKWAMRKEASEPCGLGLNEIYVWFLLHAKRN